MPKQEIYDVIVVGAGAAGSMAAHVLVNKGLKVLLLEAGRMVDPFKDFRTHAWPYELKFRGKGPPKAEYDRLWKIDEYTDHLYLNPHIERYGEAPGKPFHWTRIRAVGGRTITWGRVSLRFGPIDFKPRSMQDGYGEDWPISYEDLAPYYDKVEELIGVNGSIERLPNLPDGKFLPALRLRCGETLLKKGCEKVGIKLIPTRTAVLTVNHRGRAKCHYCGYCGRGCDTASRFSSLEALIPEINGRPNFHLRTNAAVREVLVDENGKARGLAYVDSVTRQEYEVRARVVVLGASTIESTRIMLNSKSRFHPNGLGNSSGMLGHYVMDNFKAGFLSGFLPLLKNTPTVNDDGAGGGHSLIPRFNLGKKNDYLRGFQYQCDSGSTIFPNYARQFSGFGSQFKKSVREVYPSQVFLYGQGESLPYFDNYVEIDPDGLKDSLGIPQVRFHVYWHDNELKMAERMFDQAEEILRAAGAEIRPYSRVTPPPPGDATHEVGTARMGDDAKKSVLNGFGQSHDVKNLFVVDGSCFVSNPEKNPTLTIMAICWRACDYLAEELKRGNL